MILIFTTTGKKQDASKIGKGLLKDRLIVCYNLFPIESAYWWKGKNFEKIESYIKKHSGYEVPEVIAIKPSQVNKPYLNWIEKETA